MVEERGYKKGRGKGEKVGGLESCLGLWGLVVIVWPCYDFWETLETCGGFLGLSGGKYHDLVLHILLEDTLHLVGLGHGGLGNLWRFPGLGIYFLVGWEVNPVGSVRRSVRVEL